MATPKNNWKKCALSEIIFIDIETASQVGEFDELGENLKALWLEKTETLLKNSGDNPPDGHQFYFEKAGLFAEFGRVVCISIGLFDKHREFHVKSFADPDEAEMLAEFGKFLTSNAEKYQILCGHNIKEFDIPYLCRRMLAQDIDLPPQLDVAGFKPWDISHIDTMELWKFGDNKNYTKLKLILAVIGIQSPKDDIDGSQVNEVFWHDNDLERIVKYCAKDVIAVARLLLRFRNEAPLDDENIKIRDWLGSD